MPNRASSDALIAFKPRLRDNPALVCVPWAGAGAAPFRVWASVFGTAATVYGVRLPGRESRLDEPLLEDVDSLVKSVVAGVESLGDRPIVLFGHCSGALLAHEAARALGRRVTRLVVASQLPPAEAARTAADELDSESLAERYLDEGVAHDSEMRAVALRILESDIRAVSGYQFTPGLLDIPITVFRGMDDREVRSVDLAGWISASTIPSEICEVANADHMFSGTAWVNLAELIAVKLGLVTV
ncbi:thioesterase II family protein [Streptomyces laurentii]|uniref:thioesterase II family protein n=1 Tax=Streptomyces laurentii TaxID=39478 RepID=UPI0036A22E40